MKKEVNLLIFSFCILIFLNLSLLPVIAETVDTYSNISYNYTWLLGDTTFDEDTTRYGNEWFLIADLIDGTGEASFLKWNLSGLPENANITNATMCLYTYNNTGNCAGGGCASDETIDIWYSDNETWSEVDIDALCGNGVACSALWELFSSKLITYSGGNDGVYEWNCFNNLKDGVNYAIDNSSTSVTFALNHSGSTVDYYQWESRESEHDNILKPYLNLTYYVRETLQNLTISLNSPENESTMSPGNIAFNWTPQGVNDSYYCDLKINGTTEAEDIPAENNTLATQTINIITEGEYLWNVTCWNNTINESSGTNILTIATSYDDVSFNTSFEGANLVNISYVTGTAGGYRKYTAEMNYSEVQDAGYTNYLFWHYFGMTNISNKNVQIDITNAQQDDEDNNRWSHVESVYSFNNNQTSTNNWHRLTNLSNYSYKEDSNTYTINISTSQDEVFVAANYPYTYTQFHQDFLLPKNTSMHANVSLLGLTEEGRNISMITITDPRYNNSEKYKIFVLGGQHVSGEEQGIWNTRGMIEFLLNETNTTSQQMRQDYIFKIIPLADPDSSFHGIPRYSRNNSNIVDPNRMWDDPNNDSLSISNITKSEISRFAPDLFMDAHGMITNQDNQLYYPNSGNHDETGLMNNLSLYWKETGSRTAQSTSGLASVAIDAEFNILSLTIETSISRCSDNTSYVRTKEDWIEGGKNLTLGILSYFGQANANYTDSAPINPIITLKTVDGTNTTDSDLNCSAQLQDIDESEMNVSVIWYNNGVLNLTLDYNNSYINGTWFNATLGKGNTTKHQVWNCTIQLHDGNHTSNRTSSNNLTIENSLPPISSIVLNSSSNLNTTDENLTIYFNMGSDADGDTGYNITDWRVDDTSIALLNMPFDKNISTTNGTIKDFSSFENNGTLGNGSSEVNPTWQNNENCKIGGCYDFDGDNDFIEIHNDFDLTSGGTIMGWMKFNELDDDHALINIGETPGEFSIWMDENGADDRFGISIYNGTDWPTTYGTTVPNTTSWWHIAFIYHNKSTNYGQLYVNGIQEGNNLEHRLRNYFHSNWRVGIGDNGLKQHNGSIDEFKIFNRSLSPEQIYKEYSEGLNNRSTQTLVSNETNRGENWTVALFSTDLEDYGTINISDYLTIPSPDEESNPPTNPGNSPGSEHHIEIDQEGSPDSNLLVKYNDKIIFTHKEEEHTIEIIGIERREKYLKLEIRSDPILTNIHEKETKSYDIDLDNQTDISITVSEIIHHQANITVRRYIETDYPTDYTIIEENIITGKTTQDLPNNKDKVLLRIIFLLLKILGICILIIISLVLILFIRKQKKKRKFKTKKRKHKSNHHSKKT
jgi:hypothetical protein